MTASLLTGHRHVAPYGINGGLPGKTGLNLLEKSAGETQTLPSTCRVDVEAGDTLIIKTPGGGGYGVPGAKKPITK